MGDPRPASNKRVSPAAADRALAKALLTAPWATTGCGPFRAILGGGTALADQLG